MIYHPGGMDDIQRVALIQGRADRTRVGFFASDRAIRESPLQSEGSQSACQESGRMISSPTESENQRGQTGQGCGNEKMPSPAGSEAAER